MYQARCSKTASKQTKSSQTSYIKANVLTGTSRCPKLWCWVIASLFPTNSYRSHGWVGEKLTRRGAGCHKSVSCFRRGRASQRLRLVPDMGEASFNLCPFSTAMETVSPDTVSRDTYRHTTLRTAQGVMTCGWRAKNAFSNQQGPSSARSIPGDVSPLSGPLAFTKLAETIYLWVLSSSSWIPTQLAKSGSYHGVEQGQPEPKLLHPHFLEKLRRKIPNTWTGGTWNARVNRR